MTNFSTSKSRPLLWVALLVAALFSGCATVPNGPERVAGEADPFKATAEDAVGFIVLVDAEEEVALIQMRSANTRAAPSMIALNEAMVETARLEPTRFQRGRTLGTRIVSGLPNVGDEVVVSP